MRRKAHILKANLKNELPQQIVVVDTETRVAESISGRDKHVLHFGKAKLVRFRTDRGHTTCKESDFFTFTEGREFLQWLTDNTRARARTYVFAHNWNFDAAIIDLAQASDMGYEVQTYINGPRPFILKLKHTETRKYLTFLDSLNIFAMSLSALGDALGFPKGEFPGVDASREELEPYCERDVDVLLAAILQWRELIDTLDLGNFQPTLAGQAFTAFKHRFMQHPIYIHDNQRTLELERRSYMGGRTECFFIGQRDEPLYYYDVNSLYPSVMASELYPTRHIRTLRDPSLDDLRDALNDHAVVAEVDISTTENAYPHRLNDRLCFPIGEFTTTLTTPELSYALEHDHIRVIRSMAIYEQHELFTDYVQQLYAQRMIYKREGNDAFQFSVKLLLNSLYGKFGQTGRHWNTVRDAVDGDPPEWLHQEFPEDRPVKYRTRLGKVQTLSRDAESFNSFPAIAAHVTAYGRSRMWQLMNAAGLEHVLYMDTDSLIVTEQGRVGLLPHLDESRLGQLKLEGVSHTSHFYGPKDYVFDDIPRRKGVRANAIQLTDNSFEQLQFHSWDWHQKRQERGFIYVDTITKTLHRNYQKGVVNDSTGAVTPIAC